MPTTKTTKRSTAKRSVAKRSTAKRTTAATAPAKRGSRAKGKLATIDAALTVLDKAGKAMSVTEIADAAMPLTGLGGKTPKQTFYSVLYAELKKAAPRVQREDRGSFKITPAGRKHLKDAAAAA